MPYSWDHVSQFNFTNPPQDDMGRSERVIMEYDKHREVIKRKGGIDSYLKQKYLSKDEDYNMTNNMFPYHLDDGIMHYVIWFKLDSFLEYNNYKKIVSIIKEYERKNDLKFEGFTFFQNIERLRSVPGIPHIHVFAKL